jgi:uncharacterized protein (DUF362 family)
MHDVAVVKYEKPYYSLKEAINICGGFGDLTSRSKVFIKPNHVVWHEVDFPKYGVLTTSLMIEDMVKLLKEQGVSDITISEGAVNVNAPLMQKAWTGLGLNTLKDRYGVKIIDVIQGSFKKVTRGNVTLSFNEDILEADYVIDMPVLKTHSATVVSLAMKNLKGLLSPTSRRTCHNADQSTNLNYHIAKLANFVPVKLVVIDGIYSLERGPLYNGMAYRSDIIVVSHDIIAADKVGAKVMGIDPEVVPHIVMASEDKGRPTDLSDVDIKGNVDINTALKPHRWEFKQDEKGYMPLYFEKAGIKGIRFPAGDLTLCTYCSHLILYVIMGILMAKNKDKAFDDIEILHGKILKPTAGHKHTLLVGQCQVKLNRKDPLINHCVEIPGCPAKVENFYRAYRELGIELPENFQEWMEKSPQSLHMKKYAGKPEFDPSFYKIQYNKF